MDIQLEKNSVLSSKRTRNKGLTTILVAFISLICILILIPFYSLLLASFRPGQSLISYGLNLSIDLNAMSLDNYIYLFTGDHEYFHWFTNSIILTVTQVVLTLFISVTVAYGFAMYDFKFKNTLFVCVLLIMMVPLEILMLPLYQQVIKMNLVNTRTGIILPFLANASTIFFFRQYLMGIPRALLDAGRVDGASEYRIFGGIILPIIKPAFAAMAILNAMNSWNNFLWPLLVLRDSEKFTLTIGLNTLLTPYGNNYDLLFAGSCFSIIPIFILFLCFQKYFIEGMTAGSVKE